MAEHIVDNRVLVLGLDHLYREAMKSHERTELLSCATRLTAALGLSAAKAPVEGYYAEDPALTEYFLLMRALQAASAARKPAVASLPEFVRLAQVTSSPIFGKAVGAGSLLPVGRDPLAQALLDTMPDWTLNHLIATAHKLATETDDISLVGVAARTRDAVALTATRESTVLYAEAIAAGRAEPPIYVWRVDDDLAQAARRFVASFNALFHETLPVPDMSNAAAYWSAWRGNYLHGRCVRLGFDDSVSPVRHYHWAIHTQPIGSLAVQEFWHSEIWTTERYRSALSRGQRPIP